jgi:hypothetical protein
MAAYFLWTLALLGLAGWPVGVGGWLLARRWARDCAQCRILIAVKGRVKLDVPLVEVLAWNRALPHRERARGGIIFAHNGVQFGLARPKVMANAGVTEAKTRTRTVETPEPA